MTYVYFARSIRGVKGPDDDNWQKRVVSMLRECKLRPQFDITIDPLLKAKYVKTDEYIYRRDLWWIDQSDFMLAEVTYPSHGVGYEIAYAQFVAKIPVMLVCEKDTRVSAMLTGSLPVWGYRDLNDLKGMVEQFVASKFTPPPREFNGGISYEGDL